MPRPDRPSSSSQGPKGLATREVVLQLFPLTNCVFNVVLMGIPKCVMLLKYKELFCCMFSFPMNNTLENMVWFGDTSFPCGQALKHTTYQKLHEIYIDCGDVIKLIANDVNSELASMIIGTGFGANMRVTLLIIISRNGVLKWLRWFCTGDWFLKIVVEYGAIGFRIA